MSDVFKLAGVLKLVYPIELGIIEDYSAWEKLIHGLFYSNLRVSPDEVFLLCLKEPYWTRTQLMKMQEILFETFNFAGVGFLETTQVLKFAGIDSCIFGSIGANATMFTSVIDGYPINWKRYEIGGGDILNYFKYLLKKRYKDINFRRSQLPTLEAIQHDAFYVSLNPEAEKQKIERSAYLKRILNIDDQEYEIDYERFQAPEVLFDTSLIHSEIGVKGIPEMIKQVYENENIETRDSLIKHIFLCGGTAGIPNLDLRLKMELEKIMPNINWNEKIVEIPSNPDKFMVETAKRCLNEILKNKNERLIFKTNLQYQKFGPEWGI